MRLFTGSRQSGAPRRLLSFVSLAVLMTGTAALAQNPAPTYETAPVFQAASLLTAEQRSGPHHTVADSVPTAGYNYQFSIASDYGPLTAEGRAMLDVRLQEIQALDELAKTTRSDAFGKAVAHAATGPYRTAVSFVSHPVKTVTGIPGGVGRFLKGITRTGSKAVSGGGKSTDDQDDKAATDGTDESDKTDAGANDAARGVLGMNSAKRRIAAELGVDPYSRNEPLQAELDRVAWASTAGGLLVRFAVPGVSEIGYLADVEQMVWNVSPAELEALNAEALGTMNVSKATQDGLFANDNFTPTLITTIVHSLSGLQLKEGQEAVVALAVSADSPAAAAFVTDAIAMLHGYHARVAPIAAVHVVESLVSGTDTAGTVVLPLPVDYLSWDADIDVVLGTLETGGARRELHLGGVVSPAAVNALQARGWTIVRDSRANLLAAKVEAAQ